jgi:hypothetical protein
MLLQGNLQLVFEALHRLGIIDPVLKKNWSQELKSRPEYDDRLAQAVRVANETQGDVQTLERELHRFDEQTLSFLAMEVAREFASYQARQILH